MKILFLTSSPGFGHTRAAHAIDLALRIRYPDVESQCLDVTSLIDVHVSEAVQDGYLNMTAYQPELYQKIYDMDKSFYRQLSGQIPADKALIDFLTEQQQKWYPETADRSLFSLPASYNNLDNALLNSLINGVCNRTKIPAGRLLLQGVLALIFSILSARLKNYVNNYAPQLIVATQMYPNALLSRSIQKGAITQPIIGVLTDYGAHGVWVRNTTTQYCVGHSVVAKSLRAQGVPAEKIAVTGIPLMPEFESTPSRQIARKHLGLEERPTLLITGGQCGIGIVEAVRQLIVDGQHSYQILVTKGNNSNDSELEVLARQYPEHFKLLPWSDQMSGLLRAADIIIGKPGGLTVSETLACGRPFIATCCLGGQESHNVNFLESIGAGRRVNVNELPMMLNNLFSHKDKLFAMEKRAQEHGRPFAAQAVAAQIEKQLTLMKQGQSGGSRRLHL